MSGTRVLINGGGICGLTTALSLARRGVAVKVFEQRPEYDASAGRALVLLPKSQSILSDLGLQNDLDESTHPLQKLYWMNQKAAKWHQSDLNWIQDTYNHSLQSITHADLHTALLNALPKDLVDVQMGTSVTSFEEDEKGVTVKCSDGSEERGTVLVAADGANSTIRQQLFGPTPVKYSGRAMFWGHNQFKDLGPWREDRNEVGQRFGKGGYFAHIPLKNGDVSWFMAIETEWATEGDFVPELQIEHYQSKYKDLLTTLRDELHAYLRICNDRGVSSFFSEEIEEMELSNDSEQWIFDIETFLKSFYQLADFEFRDQTEIRKVIEELEWAVEQAQWLKKQVATCNNAVDMEVLKSEFDIWRSKVVIQTPGGLVRHPKKYGDTRKDSLSQRLFFRKHFPTLLSNYVQDKGLNPFDWSSSRQSRLKHDEVRPLINAVQVKIDRLGRIAKADVGDKERYLKKQAGLQRSLDRLVETYTTSANDYQKQFAAREGLVGLVKDASQIFSTDTSQSQIKALFSEMDGLLNALLPPSCAELRKSYRKLSADAYSALEKYCTKTFKRLAFGNPLVFRLNPISSHREYVLALQNWLKLIETFPEIVTNEKVKKTVETALQDFENLCKRPGAKSIHQQLDPEYRRMRRAIKKTDRFNLLRDWERLSAAFGDSDDYTFISPDPEHKDFDNCLTENRVVPDIDWRNDHYVPERTWVHGVHYVKAFENGNEVVYHNPDGALCEPYHLKYISESAKSSIDEIHKRAESLSKQSKSCKDLEELKNLHSQMRNLTSEFLSTYHGKKMDADHKLLEDLDVELCDTVGDFLLENWDRIDHQHGRQMVHDETRRHWAYPVEPLNLFCENYVRHDVYDREPLTTQYHRGRVICIGDAAHALPPWFLLGPNIAMEDGSLVANVLNELGSEATSEKVDNAFHLYFERRFPHLEEVFQQKEKVEYSIFTRFQPSRWAREWEMAHNGDQLLRELDWFLKPIPALNWYPLEPNTEPAASS